MERKINLGIVGYGNIGKCVKLAINQNPDMQLVAVFTRRNTEDVSFKDANAKVLHISSAGQYKNDIDVMILCGGSATDLPEQGPFFAASFNTVDSFDNHNKIPEYFASMEKSAKANGKTSAISVGWDPGLFSMNRLLAEAVLPEGKSYTFWGKGVSQGHSDAIRRVKGVKGAIQYTVPISKAVARVRSGENPELPPRERHLRECYVVVEEGADKDRIARQIKDMPNYFSDYETTVSFITEEELKLNHSAMPHGGFVIRSGKTGEGKENKQIIEFSIRLDSNPEFTAGVLVAYARAVYRLNREGNTGAKTVFDIPLAYLSPTPAADLRKLFL